MDKTKMSVATDILLEQMQRINNLSKEDRNEENKIMLKDAITTSKTLNGSASSIIKEASTCLAIEKYSHYSNQNINKLVQKLGICYDKN